MMIKKLKNMDWFDIFIAGILRLFGVIALMLVVISPIYTVASYQNKEVHQGTITDKYNKRQARLKVGDKVEVKTIGYRIHFLNLYPVLYEVKKVDKQ
ncbi:TPA: hypothetical protein PEG05_001399 [Staphylococcus aureus]|nr:hypothetical protein [Staphylococcus aureus]HDF3593801.1 hypothetical protein [Staphylococcus aureus]HDI0247603.1 hypothetical protein [Staphylococcus aureus]HEG9975051.1 hypothetical protein [Staphylococcus aureus]HEH2034852.1 hypothetical protein [Staphylococcus aureus]